MAFSFCNKMYVIDAIERFAHIQINNMAVSFLLSTTSSIVSIETIREVSVECHFFLLYSTASLLFVFSGYRVFIDSEGHLFAHFNKIGNKEIGLLYNGSSKSPSFKIGDTSRIGQVLVVKEEFTIAAIEGITIIYRYKVLDDTTWYLVKT